MMVAPPQITGIAGERAYEVRPSVPGRLMVLLLAVKAGATAVGNLTTLEPTRTADITLLKITQNLLLMRSHYHYV
jgi:hypothetical protein